VIAKGIAWKIGNLLGICNRHVPVGGIEENFA